MSSSTNEIIDSAEALLIKQKREMLEVFSGFETKNRYEIYTHDGKVIGTFLENSTGIMGFLKRMFLKSHRPFEIQVFDSSNNLLFLLRRPFFFFLSTITIQDSSGRTLGVVQKRFTFFRKQYDFQDSNGSVFASIRAQFWRIYKFPIFNKVMNEVGEITKKWRGFNLGGMATEMFTDADTFLIHFGKEPWSSDQRKVIMAGAISVDFDHFERS